MNATTNDYGNIEEDTVAEKEGMPPVTDSIHGWGLCKVPSIIFYAFFLLYYRNFVLNIYI